MRNNSWASNRTRPRRALSMRAMVPLEKILYRAQSAGDRLAGGISGGGWAKDCGSEAFPLCVVLGSPNTLKSNGSCFKPLLVSRFLPIMAPNMLASMFLSENLGNLLSPQAGG